MSSVTDAQEAIAAAASAAAAAHLDDPYAGRMFYFFHLFFGNHFKSIVYRFDEGCRQTQTNASSMELSELNSRYDFFLFDFHFFLFFFNIALGWIFHYLVLLLYLNLFYTVFFFNY